MNAMANMVASTTKPLSKMIGEVAVLATVNVSCLGQTKLDKQASADSDRAHAAKNGASKVNVKRLPGSETAIDAIKGKHTEARALLKSLTTQWGPDRRLLMNALIGELSGQMQDIITEHDELVRRFVADAPEYIAKAQANLGSYDVQPPTVEEIANAFSLTFDLSPVPDASAYTTSDHSLEKLLRSKFEENVRSAYVGAQRDLMERLAKPLENMVDRMNAYDERLALKEKNIDVGKSGTFKSTVVTNITDIAKIVKVSNINNDKFLDKLAEKLEAFEGIEHEDLVTSKELRADMAKRAKEIRDSLGGWL